MLELPRKLRVNNSMMCVLNINLKRVKREEKFLYGRRYRYLMAGEILQMPGYRRRKCLECGSSVNFYGPSRLLSFA